MVPLKTLFLITISTARLVFPGVPADTSLSPTDPPPAARSINLEVASDAPATAGSNATVAVPEGLKAGKTLSLQIDPAGLSVTEDSAPAKATVAEYWGNVREVSSNQPKVGPPKKAAEQAAGIPTRSYASWPTMSSKPLKSDAATPGNYTLTTDYCGSTSITLTDDQAFLAPVTITSADGEPDLTKAIVVRWRPVANAVGYLLRAFGGRGDQTVTWTSSADPKAAESIEYRPLSKEEADKFTKDGVLLPSYFVSANIPAGIFKDSPSVMLVLTAFGKDLTQVKDGIETQVIVRSTASLPLHSTPIVPTQPAKNANRKDAGTE